MNTLSKPDPGHQTFAAVWSKTVDCFGARTFLVFRDDVGTTTQWSYAEFDEVAESVASRLAALGVGRGDGVHVALRNCPAFVAIWLAVARLGAWFVPVDPSSTARDVRRQTERAGPVVGLCARSRSAAYRGGAKDVPVVLELAEDAGDLDEAGPLRAGGVEPGGLPAAPEDRLAVMFTSGTTAEPKGVVLTQRNYAHVAAMMARLSDTSVDSRWYVTLPLFHANAQYYCFAPAIAEGASVALTASFSASRWVARARELKVTHASLFAAPMRMILARTEESGPPLRLGHLWFAQSLGRDHHEQFADLVGCRPRQLYGMTETVAPVTIDQSRPFVHDVIGAPLQDRSTRIDESQDSESEAAATGGVLSVRGTPGVDLFLEYLDDPATTQLAMTQADGSRVWFRTGDVVAARDDGQLRFVGRLDDVIKVAGENVSLTETEAVVAQAPGVLEAAVVALPDPVRDQVTVAYVVPSDPASPPDPAELARWAVGHLTSAARPREWHLIAELPRTSVGKVRRFKVADR